MTMQNVEWAVAFAANLAVWCALYCSKLRGIVFAYQTFSATMSLVFPVLYVIASGHRMDDWQMRTYHLTYDATALVCMLFEFWIATVYSERNITLTTALVLHRLTRGLVSAIEIPHQTREFVELDLLARALNILVMCAFVHLAYSSDSATAPREYAWQTR